MLVDNKPSEPSGIPESVVEFMRLPASFRLFNIIGDLLRNSGIVSPRLSPAKLIATARRKVGLGEFGDRLIEERLTDFLKSVDFGANLTFFGCLELRHMILEALCVRLLMERDFRRHPEIGETPVKSPLIIVGLPRTGTTLLMNLLKLHQGCRSLRQWEMPLPFPDNPKDWGGPNDPRPAMFEKKLKNRLSKYPALHAMHAMDSPIECATLFLSSFIDPDIMSYHAFSGYRDRQFRRSKELWRYGYEFYKRRLQHLFWLEPGSHWVLKSNDHMARIDVILETFPDARIIQTHRDPKNCVPSISHMTNMHQIHVVPGTTPQLTGRNMLDLLGHWAKENVRCRQCIGKSRILELVDHPLETVRQIYDYFGMDFSPDMETRIIEWLRNFHYANRPRYRYSLDQFALTAAEVDCAFADYWDFFGLDRWFKRAAR
jgi:Sulfotransferase family